MQTSYSTRYPTCDLMFKIMPVDYLYFYHILACSYTRRPEQETFQYQLPLKEVHRELFEC